MPERNAKPFVWQPEGCSDAIDGAEAFPGAMAALSDLVPSLKTTHQWIARPGAQLITNITIGGSPTNISAALVIGDILYGMTWDTNSAPFNNDVPFAYNLETNTPLTVAGVNDPGNVPAQAATSGLWAPPIMTQVGERIIVTHPGFSNAPIHSGATASWLANTSSGNPNVFGEFTTSQVGDTVVGPGIPASTTIIQINNEQLGKNTGCSGTLGQSTFVTNAVLGSGAPPGVGMALTCAGNVGTIGFITNVTGSNPYTVTYTGINQNTFSGATVFWSGSQVILNNNATATSGAAGVTLNSVNSSTVTGAGVKFGWLDISGAAFTATITTINGSPVIQIPSAFGIQVGWFVSGAGIPAATTLLNMSVPSLSLTGTPPNYGDMIMTIQVADTASIPVSGMDITGAGITQGTVVAGTPLVTGVTTGTPATTGTTAAAAVFTLAVPLSTPAAGATGLDSASYIFTGLVAGVLSNAATASATITATFAGGTPTQPLWGAGDTSYNPLPSVPVGVAQMAGRSYFACGINGIPFSDSLVPCQRTSATQAVRPNDGLAISAVAGLPLLSPITGGIVQAIIGFSMAARMYVIQGDQSESNLTLNTMNVATGCRAPLTIFPCTLGLAFMSPEGLRFVTQAATVTDPMNPQNGQGVSFPFATSTTPSRMCGAANSDVLRFTVTAGGVDQEWFFYLSLKRWVGPHTCAYSIIQPWRATFVGQLKSVQQNAITPGNVYNGMILLGGNFTPSYTEAGFAMSYAYETVLLPDNPEQNSFGVTEAYIWLANNENAATITAIDETGTTLDSVSLTPTNTVPYARMIPIDKQWVFRAVQVKITGALDSVLTLGRLGLKYLNLGYQRYNS